MNWKSPRIWREIALVVAFFFSMLVGIVSHFLGQNPLDPYNLFGKNPQRDSFLWLSSVAYLIAAILSYRIWFLARAVTRRKNIARGNESLSQWEKSIMRMNGLAYIVMFPAISLGIIFGNLELLSHVEIFTWLQLVSILVAFGAAFVGVVIIGNSLGQRRIERELRQHTRH